MKSPSSKQKAYIITGGLGFIGINFIKKFAPGDKLFVIDAQHPESNTVDTLEKIVRDSGVDCTLVPFDLCKSFGTEVVLDGIVRDYNVQTIFHFAASSHVDDSIKGPVPFIQNNLNSTLSILEWLRNREQRPRFIYVSTDEVYGDLPIDSKLSFDEGMPRAPRSPYSASKAASEMMVESYYHTYGVEYIITRCCNNFGPHQHKSKFIPKILDNFSRTEPIEIYGTGENVREWIHVDDHNEYIKKIDEAWESKSIKPNTAYNIGSGFELSNNCVVDVLYIKSGQPRIWGGPKKYVNDRLGHDRRYAVNTSKLSQYIKVKTNDKIEEFFYK